MRDAPEPQDLFPLDPELLDLLEENARAWKTERIPLGLSLMIRALVHHARELTDVCHAYEGRREVIRHGLTEVRCTRCSFPEDSIIHSVSSMKET